jgi:chromate reductase
MQNTIQIAAFAGSLREYSYNRSLLNTAVDLLPPDTSYEILDLAPLPMYNQDIEKIGFPKEVEQFRSALYQADAFLIASPEYNYSIPGVLKNALDWASRANADKSKPMDGKPLAIIGVGGRFGTARAQNHLRQIASHLNMITVNRPEVLISNYPQKVFDAENNLTDQFAISLMKELVKNLVHLTRQLKLPLEAEMPA